LGGESPNILRFILIKIYQNNGSENNILKFKEIGAKIPYAARSSLDISEILVVYSPLFP
jgi:hypothetical protein